MPDLIIRLKDKESFKSCCHQLRTQNITHHRLALINAVSLSLPSDIASINQVVDQQLILRVEEDTPLYLIQEAEQEPSHNTGSPQEVPWGVEKIGAIYSSIPKRYHRPKVAIMDSGLSLHPALNISSTYANFSSDKKAQDQNGHGTHLAGIIGGFYPGKTKNKQGFHGVYPQLQVTSVKVFNQEGTASVSRVIQGLEWSIQQNMRIINMSFGLDTHHLSLHEAIRLADQEGLIMVAASGNKGKPGLEFPARYPEVVSVGAINQEEGIASFSQYGTSLDLVAPGEQIFSTWIDKSYRTLSGTSMACAHVTGVFALILALKPEASATEAKNMAFQQAQRLPVSYLLQGHGLVSMRNIANQLKK